MPERPYSVLGGLNDPDALRSKIEESDELELSVISDDTHDPEHLVLKKSTQGEDGFGYKYEYDITGVSSTISGGKVTIVILNGKIDLTIITA